jgi:hypothetical protein
MAANAASAAVSEFTRVTLTPNTVATFTNSPIRPIGIGPSYLTWLHTFSGHTGVVFLDSDGDPVYSRTYDDTTNTVQIDIKASCADSDALYFFGHEVVGGDVSQMYIFSTSLDGASINWTYRVDRQDAAAPSFVYLDVDTTHVYIAANTNNGTPDYSNLLKINKSTGAKVWATEVNAGYMGVWLDMYLKNGRMFIGMEEGFMAIDTDGTVLWTKRKNDSPLTETSGLAVDDNYVYVVSLDVSPGAVYVTRLTPSSGAQVDQTYWTTGFTIDGTAGYGCATVTNTGKLFFTFQDNGTDEKLYLMEVNTSDMTATTISSLTLSTYDIITGWGLKSDHDGNLALAVRRNNPTNDGGIVFIDEDDIASSQFADTGAPPAENVGSVTLTAPATPWTTQTSGETVSTPTVTSTSETNISKSSSWT